MRSAVVSSWAAEIQIFVITIANEAKLGRVVGLDETILTITRDPLIVGRFLQLWLIADLLAFPPTWLISIAGKCRFVNLGIVFAV